MNVSQNSGSLLALFRICNATLMIIRHYGATAIASISIFHAGS